MCTLFSNLLPFVVSPDSLDYVQFQKLSVTIDSEINLLM